MNTLEQQRKMNHPNSTPSPPGRKSADIKKMNEKSILKHILLKCSRGSSRLFRNNVGQYQDKAGNWIRYGLGNPGGSDLIGWCQIKVKPEHVGMVLAVFAAVEVKRPGQNATDDQQRFGNMVSSAGGIFGVAHNPEEAENILRVLTI